MFKFFRQALALLSARDKKRVYLILVTSALAAVVQTLSILSIMPFIILLANPDLSGTSPLLTRAFDLVGAQSYRDLLIIFGILAILALTLGNLFVAFEQWLSHRFLCLLEHKVAKLVLQKMLSKPYEYIMQNHSARLSDIVLRQVERVVEGVIGTFVSIFSSLSLAFFVMLTLLIVSLKTTLLTLAGLLIAYLSVFLLLRRRVESHGEELTELSAATFTTVKETLDGMKEVKTRRAESFFSRRFEDSSLRMSKLAIRYGLMSFLPHYLLETVVFAGFVAVALYFIFTTADAGVSLSFMALYGMAVYRLVPALKGVFEGITTIHHNADAVQVISEQCRDHSPFVPPQELPRPSKDIKLERVTYRYAGAENEQLSEVTLSIPVGSSVCLFGASGSGKTTILNLLVGLISPVKGQVLCDDIVIGPATIDSWRDKVGYSPQQIFLFADTLSTNIAFGVAAEAVDQNRVVAVGKIAKLHEFVSENLPQGYQSFVGERGETISGGQRQRVGIARTLYHDPDVLMFDESFTGLDAENRKSILDNLFALPGKTLIFSSHESAIASRCDKIVIIEQGKLIAEGSYQQLLDESPYVTELLTRLDLQERIKAG